MALDEMKSSTIPPWYGRFQISPPLGTPGPSVTRCAIDRKRRADSCSQGEPYGTAEATRRSGANFAKQIRIGVIEKAHLGGLETESLGQPLAQVDSIEIGQFVAHQAHARLKIERSGHGEHRPHERFAANAGFHSQVMEEIEESAGSGHRCVRRAGDGAEA